MNNNFEHHYKGFHECESVCGVKIVTDRNYRIVTLTELEKNTGTSITNLFEKISTEIYNEHLKDVKVEDIIWIEHYPENKHIRYARRNTRVFLEWDGEKFCNPDWLSLDNHCMFCKSNKLVKIIAKCNDLISISRNDNGKAYSGYVNSEFAGIYIGGGDYIDFMVCTDCRRLQILDKIEDFWD